MDREQLARECIRIEMTGGDVREFLKSRGCISPWGTWFRLQREELGRESWQITDGKGSAEMQKVTLEQKKKAVEIAIAGGNPLPYLKECGSKKPESLWYVIKQNLKEVDPKKYANLPDLRLGKKKEDETVKETLLEVTGKTDDAIERAADTVPVCTKPLIYYGFEVTGLRTAYGDFRVSNNGYLFFGSNEKDEVEMPVEIWQQLAADLPKVMAILGISSEN